MTDMTAEQAIEMLADMAHMEDEEYTEAGGNGRVESLQAIIRQALTAPRVPPDDPLGGLTYQPDGDANFYTLSRPEGRWVARIQFNGELYGPEQERILESMLGDRNVRYGDGYHDGLADAWRDQPRVLEGWRQWSDSMPKIGQRCIVCIDGVVQDEPFTLDYGDTSDQAGSYFWDHPDCDECPEPKETDLWIPWPTLTTAPAPAEPICKHCGNPTMHVGDVCYSCCQAPAESNNFGASFSKMPPYEYQRQASSGDGRIAATIAPAPADSELARLRDALDKIQAIADGYVSEGELPVMVVVQTICKQALAGGSDE